MLNSFQAVPKAGATPAGSPHQITNKGQNKEEIK